MSSRLFAIVFILAAFSVSLWMINRLPNSITLHINQNWHVALLGEQNIQNISYSPQNFRVHKQDSASLWLEGYGTIEWMKHQIKVEKNILRFNNQVIERSRAELDAKLMFYPDGHVTKGNTMLKPVNQPGD